jgi:excinuclease UvrABC nuclease subunit
MIELPEINITPEYESIINCKQATIEGGIYFFYNSDYELMYLGKASNIKTRISNHMSNSRLSATRYTKHNFSFYKFAKVSCPVDRDIYETYFINKLKPKLNVDRVFLYETDYYTEKYNPQYHIETNIIQDKLYKAMDDFSL